MGNRESKTRWGRESGKEAPRPDAFRLEDSPPDTPEGEREDEEDDLSDDDAAFFGAPAPVYLAQRPATSAPPPIRTRMQQTRPAPAAFTAPPAPAPQPPGPPAPAPPAQVPILIPTGATTIRHGMAQYHGTNPITFEAATLRDLIRRECLRWHDNGTRFGHCSGQGRSRIEFDTSGRLKLGSTMMRYYFDLRLLSRAEWDAMCRDFARGIFRAEANLGSGKGSTPRRGVNGTVVPVIDPPPAGYDYDAPLVPMLFPNGNPQQPQPVTAPLLPQQPVAPLQMQAPTAPLQPVQVQPRPRQPLQVAGSNNVDLGELSDNDMEQEIGEAANSSMLQNLPAQRPERTANDQADVETNRVRGARRHSDRRRVTGARPVTSQSADEDSLNMQQGPAPRNVPRGRIYPHPRDRGRSSNPVLTPRYDYAPINDIFTVREDPALRRSQMEGRHFDNVARQWHFPDGSLAPTPIRGEFLRMPEPPPANPDPRPWTERHGDFAQRHACRGAGSEGYRVPPANVSQDDDGDAAGGSDEDDGENLPDAPSDEPTNDT